MKLEKQNLIQLELVKQWETLMIQVKKTTLGDLDALAALKDKMEKGK